MTVKRPMLLLSAAIVAGMYLFALLNVEASLTVLFLLFLATIIACIKNRKLYINLILIGAFLLLLISFFYYAWREDVRNRPLYQDCGKQCVLTGEIFGKVEETERYVRFSINAETIEINGRSRDVKERISVICFRNASSIPMPPVLNRGNIVTINCKISTPDSAMNTNGFDYSRYLKSQGIYFETVADATQISVVGSRPHFITDAIYRFRMKCVSLFDAVFPAEESGVLKAYIVGDSSGITTKTDEIFSASGLSHVLSVSGMHVAVFLSFITAFLRFLKISKRKQMILSLCFVLLFVVFTGASIATLRAGFVCLFALGAQLVFKHSDPLTALAEAAAILCVYNPLVILDASFLLSFSASLGIILFAGGISRTFARLYKCIPVQFKIRHLVKTICDLTAVGISANLVIIPILVALFNQFSIVSILATIAISPLLTPILVGGLLFCIVGIFSQSLAYPIAGFLFLCTKWMILIANRFSSLPFATISWGNISPFILLFYAIFVAFICFTLVKYNKRGYYISLYSVLVLLFVLLLNLSSVYSVAKVYFINVGQGDCSVIDAPGDCEILVDAGGKESNGSVGENVVKPYLLQNGIYDIEYAIASHGHADHVNGLTRLLEIMKVKHLLVPQGFGMTDEGAQLLQRAAENNVPITFLKHGDVLQVNDDMQIHVILPDEKILPFLDVNDENDRSLLLKLEYGDVSFLYTGDLTNVGENYAATIYPELLKADVLKIAHHGAEASDSQKFLDAVNPEYAYIPVGENSYGHPSPKVIERLKTNNISYYRADYHHDVCFYFDQFGIKGITYNKEMQ